MQIQSRPIPSHHPIQNRDDYVTLCLLLSATAFSLQPVFYAPPCFSRKRTVSPQIKLHGKAFAANLIKICLLLTWEEDAFCHLESWCEGWGHARWVICMVCKCVSDS